MERGIFRIFPRLDAAKVPSQRAVLYAVDSCGVKPRSISEVFIFFSEFHTIIYKKSKDGKYMLPFYFVYILLYIKQILGNIFFYILNSLSFL